MEYGLTIPFSSGSAPIELSQVDFEQIRAARANYLTLLGVEEKMDVVLENYAEYESTLYGLTFRQMFTFHLPHPMLVADMRLINRRLLNLLAAAKLYLDQLAHDIASLYSGSPRHWHRIDQRRRELHSKSVGYRVAEELRRHIQHRDLPITTLFYDSIPRDESGDRYMQHGIDPKLDTAGLAADGKFKKDVLRELQTMGPKVPVTPLIREYVGCLGLLHEFVREVTDADASRWEGCLTSAIERGRSEFGDAAAFAAVRLAEDGSSRESHQVFPGLLELRLILLRKNALLARLSRRYVSGELIRQDA